MDLKCLNTFINVAELGNFSKAGERLGYSQPTVSVQIKQLETELGIKLFDRIGHAVKLTEQGKGVLVYAQQICRLYQQMSEGETEQGKTETVITMALADSLCFPIICKMFTDIRQRCPHISFKIKTAGTSEMFSLLDHNEVDVVCTLDSHIYNTNYVIADEEKVGLHFVVCANNPLSEKDSLSIEDIVGQSFMLTEKNMSYRRLLDEWLAKSSVELQPILEIGSADLICSLVEKNIGISFLPDYVTEKYVKEGRIVRLRADGFEPELWKQVLYHKGKWVSRPMGEVLEQLKTIRL